MTTQKSPEYVCICNVHVHVHRQAHIQSWLVSRISQEWLFIQISGTRYSPLHPSSLQTKTTVVADEMGKIATVFGVTKLVQNYSTIFACMHSFPVTEAMCAAGLFVHTQETRPYFIYHNCTNIPNKAAHWNITISDIIGCPLFRDVTNEHATLGLHSPYRAGK